MPENDLSRDSAQSSSPPLDLASQKMETDISTPEELVDKKAHELDPAVVEGLENLNVYPDFKAELLLVMLGKKPATDYRFSSRIWLEGQPEETEIHDTQTYQELVNRLGQSGLAYRVSPDEIIDPIQYLLSGTDGAIMRQDDEYDFEAVLAQHQRELRRVVWIGRTPEDVDRMEQAYKANDAKLLGQAYGFPDTAIQAYLAQNPIPYNEVGNYVSDPDARAFSKYVLSKDNWQDEIKVAQEWAKAIKVASPKIYDLMVSSCS